MKHILLIQLRRIGDVLMTTPALRSLKLHYPDSQITFLTEPPSNQVLEHSPYLHEVISVPKNMGLFEQLQWIQYLRLQNFELVIDFFGNPRSAFLTRATGAAKRIGFDFRGRRYAYTDVVAKPSPDYAVCHKATLLGPLGISLDNSQIDFFISDKDRAFASELLEGFGVQESDFLVTLSPVSRQIYKVWAAEKFAAIADLLIETKQAKLLFIYGPGEEYFVDEVQKHMKQQALPKYLPPTLAQTKALFERAQLHVGNDNGPCHFAIAAEIPTVTVFGKPKAINWTPPNSSKHQAVEYDPGCKSQCTFPKCSNLECIQEISVEDVWKRVGHVLELDDV